MLTDPVTVSSFSAFLQDLNRPLPGLDQDLREGRQSRRGSRVRGRSVRRVEDLDRTTDRMSSTKGHLRIPTIPSPEYIVHRHFSFSCRQKTPPWRPSLSDSEDRESDTGRVISMSDGLGNRRHVEHGRDSGDP